MNVTELARILKVTPQELRDYLPQLGFDIGQKAIKINRTVADRIIKQWPVLKKKIEIIKKSEQVRVAEETTKDMPQKKLQIPALITVRELAAQAEIPVNTVLSELMKNGVFVSLNEKIDFETAWLVGSELGIELTKLTDNSGKQNSKNKTILKKIIAEEDRQKLLPRPPVVVVMGHVDHGKTKLLDTIRRTHVIDGEAGGITQHIGAYQVERKKKLITFIDTPGHEAFTAMRSRGAKIADIAILVVAADDGVKPQTIEAYRIIEAAKIPFIVAINKIDKEGANINNVMQELSNQLKLVPEEWGGKTICQPISALKGDGVDNLLDTMLLLAETEEDNILANPKAPAVGTIIESNIDKGAGPIATILVQNGTLKVGDSLVLNNMNIGKARRLNNYRGEQIEFAEPATPVQIIGLKSMLQVGDVLQVGEGEKIKHKKRATFSPADVSSKNSNNTDKNCKIITIIIKSDVLGSAEAIEESLEKINTQEVRANIIHKGLGNISDGDIKQAEAAKAIIFGFNVKLSPVIEDLARERGVEIKIYTIIYDLINDIKKRMEELVGPDVIRTELGKLEILAVFKTNKNHQIVGGKIISGLLESGAKTEVWRNNVKISQGQISNVQCGKESVNTVEKSQECGMQFEGDPIIEIGDILHFYKEENIDTKL